MDLLQEKKERKKEIYITVLGLESSNFSSQKPQHCNTVIGV